MKYKKTILDISLADFMEHVKRVKFFTSLTGKRYQVMSIQDFEMAFIRESTEKLWKMDLRGVRLAYLELTDFKTINFKSYVRRTHSPALGLLLHLGLLIK